jgi:ParB family transcriptional regulator, chromosome partitioning protein
VPEILEIPLGQINAPEYDFRSRVDMVKLGELKASLKNQGLIHPVLVRPAGDEYELVAGLRRTIAAQQLGWRTIRAEVREMTDDEAEFIKLSENIHREEVTPVDEMRFFLYLKEKFDLNDDQISVQIGKSRAYVTQRTAMQKWPEGLREDVELGELGWSVAMQIARLKDIERIDYYRFYAKEQGANYALVKYWVDREVSAPATVPSQVPEMPGEPLSSWQPIPILCKLCDRPSEPGNPWVGYPLCPECRDMLLFVRQQVEQEEEEE